MNRKWIAATLTLTLGAVAGAYVLHATGPWTARILTGPASGSGNYVRMELPPAQKIEPHQLTARDTAVILRVASEQDEAEAGLEATPEPGFSTDLTARPQAQAVNLPPPAAQAPEASEPNGILAVSFDLSRPDKLDGSSLDVLKTIRFNGADAGKATIRVGNGSALFIASDDLRTLLLAAKRNDLAESLSIGAEGTFVGFDEVRRAGLNLRYDALSDRIVISG